MAVLLPSRPQAATVDLSGVPPILQAAAYLYLDDLERSHAISQSVGTEEGALWHGIMHRREGDFWNSKYWFRHAGSLPTRLGLDPAALTDAFERTPRGENPEELVAAQRNEWRRLFDHCAGDAK